MNNRLPTQYLASPIHMDRPGIFLHWGVVQISLANLIVILLMLVALVLAIAVPFPGRRQR